MLFQIIVYRLYYIWICRPTTRVAGTEEVG